MIDIDDVLELHSKLIDVYGGSKGLRDRNSLESAINRPFQTFGKRELYPSSIEKAGAITESIVKNHPFIDGNKRVAYYLCRNILLQSGYDLKATENSRYNCIVEVATGKRVEEIVDWLKVNSKKIN